MYTRRDFLRAGCGALALSLAAACAPTPNAPQSSAAKPTGAPSSAATLPTYVAFQGPKPDFPPSADGIVPAGYLTFPQTLVKTTTGPVGKQGDAVSFLTYSINPTPAPADQNPAGGQGAGLPGTASLTYSAAVTGILPSRIIAFVALQLPHEARPRRMKAIF